VAWPGEEVGDVEFKVVLYLPRDAASVPISRQVLDGCLETLGVTEDTRTDIALALSEACANVVLHAGEGQEYEVMARARDGRCVIEVVNAGEAVAVAPANRPVPLTAEHGRGLKIIDAVTDNMRLTGDGSAGTTTVHFEKALQWVPGAPGEHLSHGGA
jgi:serine/threonine-protein kinase RsbW